MKGRHYLAVLALWLCCAAESEGTGMLDAQQEISLRPFEKIASELTKRSAEITQSPLSLESIEDSDGYLNEFISDNGSIMELLNTHQLDNHAKTQSIFLNHLNENDKEMP